VVFAAGALVLSLTSIARAEDTAVSPSPTTPPAVASGSTSPIAVDIGAVTYVPLMVGVEGTVEFPYRVLAQVGVGFMPASYSDADIDLVKAFGGLDDVEASLLEAVPKPDPIPASPPRRSHNERARPQGGDPLPRLSAPQ
jgi:hypothetical protein